MGAALALPATDDPFALVLERWDGRRWTPARVAPDRRYAVLYFGASWCGPCRAFVPSLIRAYPRLRGTEVVFISDDTGCGAQRDYVVRSRMPWPMLPCGSRARARLRALGGPALPGLLVLDRMGGIVLTSWRGGRSYPAETLARLIALAEA